MRVVIASDIHGSAYYAAKLKERFLAENNLEIQGTTIGLEIVEDLVEQLVEGHTHDDSEDLVED